MRERRWCGAPFAAAALLVAGTLAAGCGGSAPRTSYGATVETTASSYGGGGASGYDDVWRERSTGSYGSTDSAGATMDFEGEADEGADYEQSVVLESEARAVPREPAAAPASDHVASTRSEERPMIAQATPRQTPPTASTTPREQAQAQAAQTATDAVDTSGPLLIYTALMHLAVYEVAESQERIVAATRELGGFVFTQADDRLVVRVPAPRFHALIEQVEQAGDVEHREVQAQDVSEEFHDVDIRIRNLEAMRRRVETLLAQAQTVEDALRVEQQLQRITEELERLRGRQRFLADRIAFSTVTVLFRPRPRELLGQPDIFQLPFPWLDQLGLATLLDLR
ncbi:DUF4349 domain-containing protein [Sandaracinus amylolyticus]|uniref:DUF4349 domain-containing protein n=1 Tax=Sandaracinus amylolyticus TaxID=927083 RepID=UPI001F354926|nr:DUF4349 domain-containing protein [Sandaracinus amylolyticus]UJR81303.1 Hypothetical protein I5071_33600 [Sandaracinus amylolyticus]